jgi:DMSO/TMAO reductase YedYZ molybdopterin-dependent catalytic subunit
MSNPPISRGFRAKSQPIEHRDRIPPGQHLVSDFPVLSAGPTPQIDLARWRFSLRENGKVLKEWNWEEFNALPQTDWKRDIHCVTTWSKLDTHWRGVTVDDLLRAVGRDGAPASYVMMHSAGGYTTNLPSADLVGGKAMVATLFEGKPLEPEHGWPARLVVPHLYFWKSAKWLIGLDFIPDNRQGFWEELGYHDYGDPWQEQRYVGD